jgi:hypothetical protein
MEGGGRVPVRVRVFLFGGNGKLGKREAKLSWIC